MDGGSDASLLARSNGLDKVIQTYIPAAGNQANVHMVTQRDLLDECQYTNEKTAQSIACMRMEKEADKSYNNEKKDSRASRELSDTGQCSEWV